MSTGVSSPNLTLSPKALWGLVGRILLVIDAITEADLASILLQFLVCLGNAIGRGPHFRVEADRHGLNLMAVIVGKTSAGRKGTGYGQAKRLVELADPAWAKNCILSGVSSGEGVINAVRDDGVNDRRLLLVETEFARCLKVAGRKDNPLTDILRQAWDGAYQLRVLTKTNPVAATDAHISMIGHCTMADLETHLNLTDIGNGYANRNLWCLSNRSKLLPEGGELDEGTLRKLGEAVRDVIAYSKNVSEMKRSPAARERWIEEYPRLTEEREGTHGVATGRAAPQVLRLACLYALLDQSSVIEVCHLEAALALWAYCDESARIIFGSSVSKSMIASIRAALLAAPNGLTKTSIHDLFNRNADGARIEACLQQLEIDKELFRMTRNNDKGRHIEYFVATQHYAHAMAPAPQRGAAPATEPGKRN